MMPMSTRRMETLQHKVLSAFDDLHAQSAALNELMVWERCQVMHATAPSGWILLSVTASDSPQGWTLR